MKKTILLAAIILPLFIGSASARSVVEEVVDDVAVVFHKTTLAFGNAIDETIGFVSGIFGLHDQKVPPKLGRALSPAEIFHNAKVDEMSPAEESSSLVLASVYPELEVPSTSSSVQKFSTNKGSLVLNELKRQEENEDLIASEYTAISAEVNQDLSSPIPLVVGSGTAKSPVLSGDNARYDDANPNANMEALYAEMASAHTRNPNSTLLSKADIK